MKKYKSRPRTLIFSLCLALFHSSSCFSQVNTVESPADLHWYLGQNPSGSKPEVFAPGIISGKFKLHGFPTFSPDGREIYFSAIPPQIMFMKYADGKWSQPQPAPFSDGHNITSANFSPDGQRLYYQSLRPGGLGSVDIWYVERSGSGWNEPKNLGAPVNSSKLVLQRYKSSSETMQPVDDTPVKDNFSGGYRHGCQNNYENQTRTDAIPAQV